MGVATDANIVDVLCGQAKDFTGLQAVDYFLWALQRALEAKEDSDWRFWDTVQSKVRLVHDRDDNRKNSYGVYYNPHNPLTPESQAKKRAKGAKK